MRISISKLLGFTDEELIKEFDSGRIKIGEIREHLSKESLEEPKFQETALHQK